MNETENNSEIELTKKVGPLTIRVFFKARVPRMTSDDFKPKEKPEAEPLFPKEEKSIAHYRKFSFSNFMIIGLDEDKQSPDYCDFTV